MSARLQPLWDFNEVEGTEARLRARLEALQGLSPEGTDPKLPAAAG